MSLSNPQTIGGALSLCLGLVLWFWLIPHWVEPDPDLRLPVSLVPQVVATGLMLCGLAALGFGLHGGADKASDTGFAAGELRGFLALILLLFFATIAFQFLHFLIVAPVLVAVSMWMFGPLRPISLILTATLGPVAIWFIGTDILGRVLP